MKPAPARARVTLALGLSLAGAAGCDVRATVLEPARSSETWTAEPARSADAFVETLQVGTHLGATAAADDNYAVAKQLLGELGVRHALDLSSAPDLGRVAELGAMGVRFQIWIDTLGPYFQSALAMGGAVEAYEVDALAGGMTPDAAALEARRSFCAELFAAVKGSAHPVTVVGPDVRLPIPSPPVDFGPCVDFGTVHREKTARPATAKDALGFSLDDQWAAERPRAAGRPLMLGLEGYSTDPGDPTGAVSELVQAKYLSRLAFEAFNRGFVRVHLGGVTDRPDEPNGQGGRPVATAGAVATSFGAGEGLAHFDGTPKPSFTATHNLIGLLADVGQPAATGRLAYRLEGAPATVHHTLLQKRDGTYVLVLWLEVASTDVATTVPVTLRLAAPARQLTTFVPRDGVTATGQSNGAGALSLEVADDLTLVQISVDDHCDRSKWRATASVAAGTAAALDGDLTTRWTSSRLQDGTDWFAVDFGGTVTLTSITLNDSQSYPGDYPGSYEVRASLDGVTFDDAPFATGDGADGATTIELAARPVRAVKVSQVGTSNATRWWGIGEFQTTCAP
jgi:hypothetical protein